MHEAALRIICFKRSLSFSPKYLREKAEGSKRLGLLPSNGMKRDPEREYFAIAGQSPPFAVAFVDQSSAQCHIAATNSEQFLIK